MAAPRMLLCRFANSSAAAEADTCLVTMHPIGGTGWLPIMNEFVHQGVHVLACDGRYRGVDNALNMEKACVDLGNAVRHAKEKLGYAHVVLLGWSGGGSLSAFYQSQAENPTVACSPCGAGPDLTKQDFIAADGLILMAAHVSRHGTLTQWIDASITDETDPERRDPALDLYGEDIKPPYTQAFLERYRTAQIARNRKITAWVKHKLQELADKGRENEEFAFVTHGTMADPRWLDPAVDPNDRKPGWCYLGEPRIVNNGPVGLARFSTLRSWLSQWSYDDANADGPKSLAHVTTPVLVVAIAPMTLAHQAIHRHCLRVLPMIIRKCTRLRARRIITSASLNWLQNRRHWHAIGCKDSR